MSYHSEYTKDDSSSSSSSSSSPEPDHHLSKHSSDGAAASKANVFANDGSFMEMFKKYQQKQSEQGSVKDNVKTESGVSSVAPDAPSTDPLPKSSSSKPTPAIPMIGKRRGGKILPTGRVKKVKNEEDDTEYDDNDVKPKDAWSVYMSEVKRYRETVCQSDDKTRPLVK